MPLFLCPHCLYDHNNEDGDYSVKLTVEDTDFWFDAPPAKTNWKVAKPSLSIMHFLGQENAG